MDPQDFRTVVEAGDLAGILAHFADDAVLHSPVTFVPFEGKEAISRLVGILLEVFDGFHYTDQLQAEDGTLGLVFRAKVGKKDVEGLDLVRFNEAGQIRDLTVMVRPRSASEALLEAVGGRLMASQ